ncbi:AraC family transcriptional regulator [Oceanospirillum sanctuarii]|uniref:AraC family transcriptional regulator n=1 Tax=Oceanospirillum sanctuarii TaxID=1434821 RepID=UPI000A3CE95C|nr:AraC family transcriptional regulator [Oceanospirillum sanctuarii]
MPIATASSKLLEPILQLARHYPATLLDSELKEPESSDQAPSSQQSLQNQSLQQQLLDDAGLTHQDFTRPDARFPAERFTRVLSRLAKASDNPHISLRLAEATQPRMLGSTGFLISTSDTLGQALHILEEYLPILFESARLRLEPVSQPESESVRLVLKLDEPEQNVAEFFLACLLNWPRWLTGQQIPVQSVELAHTEVKDPARFRQLFAAEVVFNARENAVILPEQYLRLPCTDANKELHQLHKAFADALLGKSQNRTALTAQVRHLIREQILTQGEAIRREEVARQLGLSLRTLQRKLGELDTNFQNLYDETRKELCFQLIRKGDLSFGEIAFQLGFSNQSAFQKAFKRWAGMPPSQYRQTLKRSEAAPEKQLDAMLADESSAPFAPRELFAPQDLVTENQKRSANNETINESNLQRLLPEKLQRLNPFGLKTLLRAAVIGDQFSLNFLSRLIQEPEARLMIHLWPAQEEKLIEPIELAQGLPGFRFTSPLIQQALYEQLTAEEQQQLHSVAAQLLWQSLPESQPSDALKTLLGHLNRLSHQQGLLATTSAITTVTNTATDKTEDTGLTGNADNTLTIPLIVHLNQSAAFQALSDVNQQDAIAFTAHARRWLDRLTTAETPESFSSSDIHTSLYQQAKLELYLGDAEQALTTLNLLEKREKREKREKHQDLQHRTLRLKARILLYLNQPEEALQTLLPHLSPILPNDEKEQLVFLLNTLEEIQRLRISADAKVQTETLSSADSSADTLTDALDQLSLLEPISRLARRQSQPLLAACVISRMTQLCLQHQFNANQANISQPNSSPNQNLLNSYARYALVGYAWVASWFCGDYKLSAAILKQGLALPALTPLSGNRDKHPYGLDDLQVLPEALAPNLQQAKASPNLHDYPVDSVAITDLWHTGQVQHWLEPLPQVLIKLRRIGDLVRRRNDPLLNNEQRTLWYQLASINGDRSLNRLKTRCQQDREDLERTQSNATVPARLKTELEDAGILLADLLQGKTILPVKPRYTRPLQAANQIRAALILNQQSIWTELFNWQSPLENDLPGFFMITETLFSLGMMRLILSLQENQTSPRRLRLIDQTESRFELWSRQAPENFAGQYHLLRAEKQRLVGNENAQETDCAALFEQAIRIFAQQGFQSHQALAYERYSIYLQSREQNILAELCLQKARKLYQSWGATVKVNLLEQSLERDFL